MAEILTWLRRPRPVLRAALEVANAANGVHPLGRDGHATLPVFAFGWPTTELAPLYLGASVVDAGRRGLRGDFAGRRGKVALGLTGLAWALLGVIAYRNARSFPPLERALRDALGEDYASTTGPGGAHRPHGGVIATSLTRHRYVESADTIRYGPHGRANLADIWRRADLPRDGRAPVVLQVPGGGWAIGRHRPQGYPLMSHLAEQGWICVSIAYRVSPRHTWPDHIVDVKRALAWIKENIADYGGNPDFVAITGGSAGGHLAALAALTPDDPRYQPGFAEADTSVVAAVPLYGRYDWFSTNGAGRRGFVAFLQKFVVKKPFAANRRLYRDASPITRVRPDAPPFFVLHGSDDSMIPVEESRQFVAALRRVSTAPIAYAEMPHAQHAFDFYGSPRAHYTAEAVGRFLSWVHAGSTTGKD